MLPRLFVWLAPNLCVIVRCRLRGSDVRVRWPERLRGTAQGVGSARGSRILLEQPPSEPSGAKGGTYGHYEDEPVLPALLARGGGTDGDVLD
jgi:hypothetical protein